jgi:hypothetical protein
MSQYCPRCPAGKLFGDDESLCVPHVEDLLPYVPETEQPADQEPEDEEAEEPESGDPDWDRSGCWHCGTVPPDQANTECLNPACRRPLAPPALLLRFGHGEVEVDLGARAELGRLGPHARVFRIYPNVSRRHAVVGVDPDGRAWIEPRATPNGTFVNGSEIPAETRRTLRSGQRIRLALHAEGTATVYTR